MRTVTSKHIWKTVGRVGIFLLVTALLLTVAAAAALFVTARGPSGDARRRLAATLIENDSPLAHVFFTDAELGEASYYAAPRDADAGIEFTDAPAAPAIHHVNGGAWDAVVIENIDPAALGITSGNTRAGKNGNVSVGLIPGDASISLIGERFLYTGDGAGYNVFGIDADGVLHTGRYSAASVFNSGWRFALPAERTLISGGVPCRELGGGYSARAAIGQKKDGTLVIALVSPHGIYPRGATYDELTALMYEFGSVTAAAFRPAGKSYAEGNAVLSTSGTPGFTFVFPVTPAENDR